MSITLRQALMVGGRVLGRVDFGELAGRETSEMEGGGGAMPRFYIGRI